MKDLSKRHPATNKRRICGFCSTPLHANRQRTKHANRCTARFSDRLPTLGRSKAATR